MLLFLIITSRVYALSNILGIVMIRVKFSEIILISIETFLAANNNETPYTSLYIFDIFIFESESHRRRIYLYSIREMSKFLNVIISLLHFLMLFNS